MTVTPDGQEGSLLPPSQRDLRRGEDFTRAYARNLRALGQGFTTGRLVTPRAVTSLADSEDDSAVGDDGNPADDTQYEWEWGDRKTVTTATGDQVARLTYVPVDESLFVFWHPAGGGGLPITNEHFTLVDNVVTIFDPGILAVGDEFSFQYQFDPGVIPEPLLEGLTVRGISYTPTGLGGSPGLPTATEVGDLVVIAGMNGAAFSTSDPRFTLVSPPGDLGALYIGIATDLTPPVFTGTIAKMVMVAFVDGASILDSSTIVNSPYPANIPNLPSGVSGYAAVAGLWQQTSVVPGLSPSVDSPFVAAVLSDTTNNFHTLCSIYFWFDDTADTIPASGSHFSGAVDVCQVTVASLGSLP